MIWMAIIIPTKLCKNRNILYYYGHFDVSYITEGINLQREFLPQDLGYATQCYGCILNVLNGADTLEEDIQYPVCTKKEVYKK